MSVVNVMKRITKYAEIMKTEEYFYPKIDNKYRMRE